MSASYPKVCAFLGGKGNLLIVIESANQSSARAIFGHNIAYIFYFYQYVFDSVCKFLFQEIVQRLPFQSHIAFKKFFFAIDVQNQGLPDKYGRVQALAFKSTIPASLGITRIKVSALINGLSPTGVYLQ